MTRAPAGSAGVMAGHACKREMEATREAPTGAWHGQPEPREGRSGPCGVAERPVVPLKPGEPHREFRKLVCVSESDEVTLTGLRANPRLEARVYQANDCSVTPVMVYRAGAHETGERPQLFGEAVAGSRGTGKARRQSGTLVGYGQATKSRHNRTKTGAAPATKHEQHIVGGNRS